MGKKITDLLDLNWLMYQQCHSAGYSVNACKQPNEVQNTSTTYTCRQRKLIKQFFSTFTNMIQETYREERLVNALKEAGS